MLHITLCMVLLVYVLRQPVHSCIEPSLHQLDFFSEVFLWRLCFCSFLIDVFQFVMRCHLHTCGWCIILAHVAVHRWMASNSQYTLPSQSSLQKGTGGKSQLCSKQSSNGPFTENFLTIGGNLERYMYRVTALGWLKKEEERKKEDKLFWLLTFSGLPL